MRFDITPYSKYKKKLSGKNTVSNDEYKKNTASVFMKKRLKLFFIFSALIVFYYLAAVITDFGSIVSILKLPFGFVRLLKSFIPNFESFRYFPLILKTLGETFLIAVTSTTCAAVLAFCFAVIGSNTSGLNLFAKYAVSALASFFRNVPLVAWAMLLLFSFKQNNFTGFSALFIITFGHLLRAFKEMIDETSADSFDALKSSGAPYISAVMQGILPNTAPGFISWLLYAVESNVRDSALIGILTGTGIGFLFNLYFKSFRYHEAGTVTFVSVITVLIIDNISNRVRQALL